MGNRNKTSVSNRKDDVTDFRWRVVSIRDSGRGPGSLDWKSWPFFRWGLNWNGGLREKITSESYELQSDAIRGVFKAFTDAAKSNPTPTGKWESGEAQENPCKLVIRLTSGGKKRNIPVEFVWQWNRGQRRAVVKVVVMGGKHHVLWIPGESTRGWRVTGLWDAQRGDDWTRGQEWVRLDIHWTHEMRKEIETQYHASPLDALKAAVEVMRRAAAKSSGPGRWNNVEAREHPYRLSVSFSDNDGDSTDVYKSDIEFAWQWSVRRAKWSALWRLAGEGAWR